MRGNLSASMAAGAIFTADYFQQEDHGKEKKKRKTLHIQDYGEGAH